MEKMYEVLRFVEKELNASQVSIACRRTFDLLSADNTQLDKAVLFEWFRQIAGEIRKVSAVETWAELSLSDPI